jgi:hypothetical protein
MWSPWSVTILQIVEYQGMEASKIFFIGAYIGLGIGKSAEITFKE